MICKNGVPVRTVPNLHEAAFTGDIREATQALADEQSPKQFDESGSTAVHKAAANGHMDVLKLLIQHGGDVELADISGCTPLHTAARNGHLTCVKYLVSQGADFRMKSKKGNTAVMMAKANNQPKVAEYLSNCDREKFAWEVV